MIAKITVLFNFILKQERSLYPNVHISLWSIRHSNFNNWCNIHCVFKLSIAMSIYHIAVITKELLLYIFLNYWFNLFQLSEILICFSPSLWSFLEDFLACFVHRWFFGAILWVAWSIPLMLQFVSEVRFLLPLQTSENRWSW